MTDVYVDQAKQYISRAGISVCYATVAIGYLYAILSASHLDLWLFALATLLHALYCAVFWWLQSGPVIPFWRRLVSLALLSALALAIGLSALLGPGWDWQIFLVTVSIYFLFSARVPALCLSCLLFVAVALNILLLYRGNVTAASFSFLQLLAGGGFVAVFSLIVRSQIQLRERAEMLLERLEASNAELAQAHQQLQEYTEKVEELTTIRERTRLAREIHDTLGHHLSILNIQMETIHRLQERDPTRLPAEITEARRVVAQAVQELRYAVAALRPDSVVHLVLPAALTQLVEECKRTQPEIAWTIDFETTVPTLGPDMLLTFYRAAQEALTNVRKHSCASKVLVRLRFEDQCLEMLVLDNGEPAATPQVSSASFGLRGIRERVELLGGQFSAEPVQPAGFRLLVRVPIA